ncbi:MAG: hypothetical protein M3O46_23165 [Myxococcota bacterium]|nr:hypothetical protein [Myxococcota bacterium]
MRAARIFERLSAIGAAAQATVPGVYAWGVTVVPPAWTRNASATPKVAAVVALLMLGAGVAGERRWGGRARIVSLWGFVAAAAVAWCTAPAGSSSSRIDGPHGLAGMLGWALFAFASAAPALPARSEGEPAIDEAPLAPREGVGRSDVGYVAGGGFLAAIVEIVGWQTPSAERALLLRLVAIVAGLSLIGVAAQIALLRHQPRAAPARWRRLRRAMAALVALAILVFGGLLFLTLD